MDEDDRPPARSDEPAAEPEPHLVTDEDLVRILARDHVERELDRTNVKRLLTGAALGGVIVGVVALVVAVFAVVANDRPDRPITVQAPIGSDAAATSVGPSAPTLAASAGVRYEEFKEVDPTLPQPPPGAVKHFDIDVFQHVTQVSKKLAPTEVWSFGVNGYRPRGTGVSPPMVVTEGDTVDIKLTNGSSRAMNVNLPHSLDFHSAEVDPSTRYADLAPGKSMSYRFVAEHPGVFLYHCATDPVLQHTGAGMVGMFVVKPRDLAPVDKELWVVQQEYYIGKPGGPPNMAKMTAKQPDVIAFNGYADQYKDHPVSVEKGERVRMYVLNAGPSIWSSFHVIGTVFDQTVVEGMVGHDAQTINLAPAEGGWVEFTLEEEGSYPFVNHAFGDMVKGSLGILKTPNAPKTQGSGH